MKKTNKTKSNKSMMISLGNFNRHDVCILKVLRYSLELSVLFYNKKKFETIKL